MKIKVRKLKIWRKKQAMLKNALIIWKKMLE